MLHVEDCVREVANTFSFEKVSDLSKEGAWKRIIDLLHSHALTAPAFPG